MGILWLKGGNKFELNFVALLALQVERPVLAAFLGFSSNHSLLWDPAMNTQALPLGLEACTGWQKGFFSLGF